MLEKLDVSAGPELGEHISNIRIKKLSPPWLVIGLKRSILKLTSNGQSWKESILGKRGKDPTSIRKIEKTPPLSVRKERYFGSTSSTLKKGLNEYCPWENAIM